MHASTAAVVLAISLACSLMNPRPAQSQEPEITPEVAWTFQTGGPIWGSSASRDGVVYFGSTDHFVYALQAATGELVWRFETQGPVYAGVSVHDGYLYAASDDGNVYKIDLADGSEIWRAAADGGTLAPRHRPADTPPGNQRWDYRGSTPVEVDGRVYVGSADHRVYAFDAGTGDEVWHFETNSIVRSTPAISEGKVVFGSFDGRVYAVDQATGEEIWQANVGGVVSTSAAVHDGLVYIGSRSTRLVGLDLETGANRWSYQYGNGSWVESAGVVYDGKLYIGSSFWSTRLAFDLETGQTDWLRNIGGSANGSALLTPDAHYCGAIGLENTLSGNMKGGILRMDRESGAIIWRYDFHVIPNHYDHGVAATPELVDGLLLFGGLDDNFYAIREVQVGVNAETSEIPSGFQLEQNYPNPFNPTTTIRYAVDRPAHVRLSVLDVQGRVVRTLVNSVQSPGTAMITWDATDGNARPAPSGVYLYRLEVDGDVQAKKMLLLR